MVTIQMLDLTKLNALLEVKVADEGVGLTPAEIERLFFPFETLGK